MDTVGLDFGEGCGYSFLYKEIKEGVITLSFSNEKVFFVKKCRTIDVKKFLEVNLEIYPNNKIYKDSIRSIDYCSCFVFSNSQKRIKIKAFEGVFTASAIGEELQETFYTKRITGKLSNLKFKNPITNKIIEIKEVLFWNVDISNTPG